jgi:hypothetical protein
MRLESAVRLAPTAFAMLPSFKHIYRPFYLFYTFGVSEDQIALLWLKR